MIPGTSHATVVYTAGLIMACTSSFFSMTRRFRTRVAIGRRGLPLARTSPHTRATSPGAPHEEDSAGSPGPTRATRAQSMHSRASPASGSWRAWWPCQKSCPMIERVSSAHAQHRENEIVAAGGSKKTHLTRDCTEMRGFFCLRGAMLGVRLMPARSCSERNARRRESKNVSRSRDGLSSPRQRIGWARCRRRGSTQSCRADRRKVSLQ